MSILDTIRSTVRGLAEIGKRSDQILGGSYWQNPVTGVGYAESDPSTFHTPGYTQTLSREVMMSLALNDPLVAAAVGKHVDDGMRGGFMPTYYGDDEREKDLEGAVETTCEELGIESAVRKACKWGRAAGWGGIFMLANGGTIDLTKPLADDQIRRLDRLIVLDARDVTVSKWEADKHYSYRPNVTDRTDDMGPEVHESHFVVFGGLDTPYRDRRDYYNGFDISVVQLIWETIRDFRYSWQSANGMMANASQTVLKIPDLWEVYTRTRALFIQHMNDIALIRSMNKIMPLDAGGAGRPSEDLQEISRSFAGIPDLLLEQKTLVAQAADMPVSKLFGVSPSGLNATGEFDERVWIGTYMAWRRQRIEPGLVRLVKIAAQTQGAVDLDNWGIEWHEVEVLTSKEKAEIDEVISRTDINRVSIGWPEESILRHRGGGGDYNTTPPLLDDAELRALEIHAELEATPIEEEPSFGSQPSPDQDPDVG